MRQCLDLSRLPKAPGLKSINTRYTTPGYAIPNYIARSNLVDGKHPATQLKIRSFPLFTCSAFSIRAMPKATLCRKDFVPPDPLSLTRTRKKKDQLDISLSFHVMKKTSSKLAVLRRTLRAKMKAAISLVITRGADAVDASSEPSIPANKEDARPMPVGSYPRLTLVANPIPTDHHLVLKDWTYIITPSLEVYRMPLPTLIQSVRKALTQLKQQASRMEVSWESMPAKGPKKGLIQASTPRISGAPPSPPRHSTLTRDAQSPPAIPSCVISEPPVDNSPPLHELPPHVGRSALGRDVRQFARVSPRPRSDEAIDGAANGVQLTPKESPSPTLPLKQLTPRAIPKLFFPSRSRTMEGQETDQGTQDSDSGVSSMHAQPRARRSADELPASAGVGERPASKMSAAARMFTNRPILLPSAGGKARKCEGR
ncbi:hypothetical protein HYDPIDRAFT_111329 [Hydnomerulius pinastri MD-312]|uniref:Uncharacterized protein n=1 Tax=Hydnomerulius pinastri MD-312 TaxID=994086 RepID=A0A0C9WG35_9AGAM|nr:hypothetical protein HYDPIDRAFT_111329 [Hydnomerulius pinastri MD-312]